MTSHSLSHLSDFPLFVDYFKGSKFYPRADTVSMKGKELPRLAPREAQKAQGRERGVYRNRQYHGNYTVYCLLVVLSQWVPSSAPRRSFLHLLVSLKDREPTLPSAIALRK